MVTGEPMPVEKETGARVTGGTINGTGTLVMRAERVGAETLLAQIVRMVGEAQRTRAPIQRLADRVAAWFVPAVVVVALIAFAAWSVWGPEPRLAHALVSAVAVLIIACPCALGLATPMAIMVGTGRGAGAGVLIRNAEALERLERVDTLVVDKTGTLTEGRPRVTRVVAVAPFAEVDILAFAGAVEQASEHPLAAAVLSAARDRGVAVQPPRPSSRSPVRDPRDHRRPGRSRRKPRAHEAYERDARRPRSAGRHPASRRRHGRVRCRRSKAGRPHRRDGPHQGLDSRGDSSAARRGAPNRDAHGGPRNKRQDRRGPASGSTT